MLYSLMPVLLLSSLLNMALMPPASAAETEGSGADQSVQVCTDSPIANFSLQDDVEIQVNVSRNTNWQYCTLTIMPPATTDPNFDGISVDITQIKWDLLDYFYVDTTYTQDRCTNSKLAVHNIMRSCAIRIRTRDVVQLHVRTSAFLKLSTMPSDQFTSCDPLDDNDAQAASLCKSTGYNQIFRVEFYLEATVEANLPINPTNCPSSLHYQRFSIQCLNQPVDNTLLIYPTLKPGTTLAKYPAYSTLLASNRRITNIEYGAFMGLDYLRFLYLDRNNLTTIKPHTFVGLDNLESLYLVSNNLREIIEGAFNGLSKLTNLYLNGNDLNFINVRTFASLPMLHSLEINGNALEIINPAIFTSLQVLAKLSLEHNRIQVLKPRTFQALGNLERLYLSYNKLANLEAETFYGLNKLIELSLEGNALQNIPSEIFNDVSNLHFLNLNQNLLTSNFLFIQNLPNLVGLYLAGNRLTTLQVGMFPNFPQLDDLYLIDNNITSITPGTFQYLTSLSVLSLQNNQLRSLSPGAFKGLSRLGNLHLSNNRLGDLQPGVFLGLDMLIHLNLTDTFLTQLQVGAFVGMPSLQQLRLNNNSIESLDPCVFTGLSKASFISLGYSKVRDISPGAFNGLHSLTYLVLNNNKIKSIKTGVFSPTESIIQCPSDLYGSNQSTWNGPSIMENLDLDNNHIQHIDYQAFSGLSELQNLQLEGNKLSFVSDCSFHGLPSTSRIIVDSPSTCCFINDSQCAPKEPASPYQSCHHLLQNDIIRIFMFVLGVSALVGNAFVIIWRYLRKDCDNAVQVFLITNLAFSDFIMGIYMLIITSADFYFGSHFPSLTEEWRTGFACKFASFLVLLSSEASIFLVTLISIDRLVAIAYPFSHFSKKTTIICLLLLWFTALVLSILPTVLSNSRPDFYKISEVCIGLPLVQKTAYESKYTLIPTYDIYEESESLYTDLDYLDDQYIYESDQMTKIYQTTSIATPNQYFSIAVFLGLNSLCCFVIIISYIVIFVNLKKKSSRVSGFLSQSFRDRRLALKMFVIITTNLCCWVAIIVLGILVQCHIIAISPILYAWIIAVVLPINSAANPFLYTIMSICGRKKESKSERIKPLMMKSMSPD